MKNLFAKTLSPDKGDAPTVEIEDEWLIVGGQKLPTNKD
jgi:hypothetical protein